MTESSFYRDPSFDGFVEEPGLVVEVFEPQNAADSKQYDFTVEEAAEMREEATVIQAQDRFKRHGSVVMDFTPPDVA